MESIPHILAWLPIAARSEETDYGKLIFFGIMVIIWIVSAIAKSAGKSKKEETWTGDPWTPGDYAPDEPTGQERTAPPPPGSIPPPPVARPPARPMQEQPLNWPGEWVGQSAPPAPAHPAYAPQTAPQYAPRSGATEYRTPPAAQASLRPLPVRQPPPIPGSTPSVAASAVAATAAVAAQERSAYRQPAAQLQSTSTAEGKPVRAARSLDAAAMRRWMTPKVMRQQYILTELFDPPAGDRRNDLWGC